jgi:hypothetical protein
VSTLEAMFPVLMLIGLISPLGALVSAILFYVHHRDRVEPARRVPVIAFILALIICVVIAGCFGLYLGLKMACPGIRQSLRIMGILSYRADPDGFGNFPRRISSLFSAAYTKVFLAHSKEPSTPLV